MKIKALLCSLLLSTQAHASYFSGNDLLSMIQSNDTVENIKGLMYIVGVHDLGDTIAFCTPNSLTVKDLKILVESELVANPARRQLPAAHSVVTALSVYPCKKKGKML